MANNEGFERVRKCSGASCENGDYIDHLTEKHNKELSQLQDKLELSRKGNKTLQAQLEVLTRCRCEAECESRGIPLEFMENYHCQGCKNKNLIQQL